MNADSIESSALHLSASERAKLAHKLLLSLDEQSEADIAQAWTAEAVRRADQINKGLVETISAQEAQTAALNILK